MLYVQYNTNHGGQAGYITVDVDYFVSEKDIQFRKSWSYFSKII